MMKLLPYELGKIWTKRSFQGFTCALLLINVFLLWYLNVPGEDEPPFDAYQAVISDIAGMTEEEKADYILGLKERVDGVCLVNDVLNLQAGGGEMGMALSSSLREDNPGLFEKYRDVFWDGTYLVYTDSLYQERALLEELYDELETVLGYGEYLDSVRQSREDLSGISIFADSNQGGKTFSSRNVEKSAKDHQGLTDADIRWYPSKGVRMAEGNGVTELLSLLSVLLFVGCLITEEKEKGLFYIIRGTRRGIAACMGAKLAALLIHCLAVGVLLGGSNLLFAGLTAGLGDLTAALQSVPAFLESNLSVSLLEYMAFGILTKALVLFGFGAALTAVSIVGNKSFMPQLAGVAWIVLNGMCFRLIPAYSLLAPLKYLSLQGLMKPRLLYGGYLNFNIAGFPVSRLSLAVWLTVGLCAAAAALCIFLYCRGSSLRISSVKPASPIPFRPHANLGLHEGYKLLLTGRGVVILLLFAVLIGYGDLGRRYSPSVREQYYRDIMLTLEGELTEEKEVLLLAEQGRFDEAFGQLERIEALVAAGEIDGAAGEDMKTRWLGVVSFYPAFQRAVQQREHIRRAGGIFLYDTGYTYLFGAMDEGFLTDFLLLSLCMIFAFGNVMAMETQTGSWDLLAATAGGKREIIKKKILVCVLCASGMAALPWVFRIAAVSAEYPLHGWTAAVQNLPLYADFPVRLPIGLFFLVAALSQTLAVMGAGGIVLLLSWRRGSYLQTTVLALLLLAAPPALALMGFDFAKWASLYPLYGLAAWI